MRRFLGATAAVIVYAIVSSIIVAMAQGYTWDVDSHQMIITGVLEINTFPVGAAVAIDTEMTSQATPFSMAYPEGVYQAQVARPGYQSWSVPLTVKSQLRTQVPELPLFPMANNWHSIASNSPQSIQMIGTSDKLISQSNGTIHVWQLRKDGLKDIFSNTFAGEVHYSCDDLATVCILTDTKSAYVLNLSTLHMYHINGMPLLYGQHQLLNFRNQYYLFAQVANDVILQKINVDGSLASQQFLEDVQSFALSGMEVVFAKDNALWTQSIIGGEPEKIIDIPTHDQVVTEMYLSPTLLVVATNEHQLFVWNRYTHSLLGTWQNARYQPLLNQLAIISDAKLWVSTSDAVLTFMGQMSLPIQAIQTYSHSSWLVTLEDGHRVLVNQNPILQLALDVSADDIVVFPYQGIVALRDHQLFYHLFPQSTWFQTSSPQ